MDPSTFGEGTSTTSGESTEQSVTGQVKERVSETAHAARERSGAAAGQVRSRISEQMDQRSTQAGQQIASTASDVRSVADELQRQGKHAPARLATQVADRADRFGGYLQSADGDRILRDIESAARQQPWAVVAGGVLLGFAASRFLKASSSRRYASTRHDMTSVRSVDHSYDVSDTRPMPTAATGAVPAGEVYPPSGAYVDEPPVGGAVPSPTSSTGVPFAAPPGAEEPFEASPTDPGASPGRGL
jgi:hypothetical protein